MSNITEVATTRAKAQQSAIETLEESLTELKERNVVWCVIVAECDDGVVRRWSGYANAVSVIGGLEMVKHAILEQYEEASS